MQSGFFFFLTLSSNSSALRVSFFFKKIGHSQLRRNSPAREDANRFVVATVAPLKRGEREKKRGARDFWRPFIYSLIYVFTFSFKYPFPLNLETDQEQDGINDAFPHGSKWDKTQGVVNQQSGDKELADAQCVVAEDDCDIFRVIVEYLLFVNGKIIQ